MNVYVIYDSHYEDSDIISVPMRIVEDIQNVGQMFCNWLAQSDIPDDYYVYINGHKCTNCETDGFIKWLNTYFLNKDEQASIVKQHTQYVVGCPKVDF